jgi:hypothetical protein
VEIGLYYYSAKARGQLVDLGILDPSSSTACEATHNCFFSESLQKNKTDFIMFLIDDSIELHVNVIAKGGAARSKLTMQTRVFD